MIFSKALRQRKVNKLLEFVMDGRQKEAEDMIQKDPSLLLEKGNISDLAPLSKLTYEYLLLQYILSKNTLKEITVLQTTFLSYAGNMHDMVKNYLAEEEYEKQLQESKDINKGRVDFEERCRESLNACSILLNACSIL